MKRSRMKIGQLQLWKAFVLMSAVLSGGKVFLNINISALILVPIWDLLLSLLSLFNLYLW